MLRTHESGRSRVAVHPYYEGLPLVGLDAVRMKAGKVRRMKGPSGSVRIPEARSRGPKSPRWSAERRARLPFERALPRVKTRRRFVTAPFGALPPLAASPFWGFALAGIERDIAMETRFTWSDPNSSANEPVPKAQKPAIWRENRPQNADFS